LGPDGGLNGKFGSLSPNIEVLIVARAIQALGTAMYSAMAYALVAIIVSKGELGRSIGIVTMFGALGFSLGPLVGGIVTEYAGWRYALLVCVPLVLVTLVLTRRLVPDDTPASPGHRFDRTGSAILFLALLTLIFPINMGQTLGWASPLILGSLVACPFMFLLLLWAERRAEDPVLRTDLFRNKKLLRMNLLSMAIILPYAGSMVVLPFYFENVRGISVTDAGLLIMCISLGVTVFGPVAGRASDRYGPKWVCAIGMGLTGIGTAILLTLNTTTPILTILASSSLIGCGVGIFNPAAFQYVLNNSPKEIKGASSGMLQTSRRISTVMGVAMMSVVYNVVFAAQEIPADSGSSLSLSPHLLHDFALGAGAVIVLIGCLVVLGIFVVEGRKAAVE
jgi:MFS family permease